MPLKSLCDLWYGIMLIVLYICTKYKTKWWLEIDIFCSSKWCAEAGTGEAKACYWWGDKFQWDIQHEISTCPIQLFLLPAFPAKHSAAPGWCPVATHIPPTSSKRAKPPNAIPPKHTPGYNAAGFYRTFPRFGHWKGASNCEVRGQLDLCQRKQQHLLTRSSHQPCILIRFHCS